MATRNKKPMWRFFKNSYQEVCETSLKGGFILTVKSEPDGQWSYVLSGPKLWKTNLLFAKSKMLAMKRGLDWYRNLISRD